MQKMKAAVFVKPGRIVLDEKPIPDIGPLDALMRVTTTTICGTDIHILKGEYPVAAGLTIGHEPVGVIEKLGSSVTGFREGQRVIAGAITPSGYSSACLCGCLSQDGPNEKHGFKAIGGWKFGNTIDGCQAEFVRVPDAMVNLAPVPDGLSDEQVLMCPDIMSTGFSGAERAGVKIGDTVAVFAQGPIGLCATMGAKLSGATTIITVDALPERLAMSRNLGADYIVNFRETDPVAEIARLIDGRGVDVAIEALGTQSTFESALRVLRPGGTRPISPYRSRHSAPVFQIFRSSQPSVQEVRSGCVALCRQFPLDVSIYDRSSPIDSSSIRSSKRTSCSAISGIAC
jgi:alcohol dehydrogenase